MEKPINEALGRISSDVVQGINRLTQMEKNATSYIAAAKQYQDLAAQEVAAIEQSREDFFRMLHEVARELGYHLVPIDEPTE